MSHAYSQDLRDRIVRCIDDGSSRRAAAARFGVSPSTAVRFQARFDATGSVAAARQGRPPGGGKLGPHRDFLIEQVELKPDITMPELATVLAAERCVQVDPSNLSKFLCKQGFSYKKNAAGLGTRTR